MADAAHPPADKHPEKEKPAEKKSNGGKKEFPWGILMGVTLGLIFVPYAAAFGAEALFGARNAFEWANDFLRRFLGTALIVLLVLAVVKWINREE